MRTCAQHGSTARLTGLTAVSSNLKVSASSEASPCCIATRCGSSSSAPHPPRSSFLKNLNLKHMLASAIFPFGQARSPCRNRIPGLPPAGPECVPQLFPLSSLPQPPGYSRRRRRGQGRGSGHRMPAPSEPSPRPARLQPQQCDSSPSQRHWQARQDVSWSSWQRHSIVNLNPSPTARSESSIRRATRHGPGHAESRRVTGSRHGRAA